MSFKEYLARRKPSADAEGDLARLASADTFPDVSTAEDLEACIIARHGSGPLRDAASSLWKSYEIAKKRHHS